MRTRTLLLMLAFAASAALGVAAGLMGQGELRVVARERQPVFDAPLATTSDASYNWAGYVAQEGEYTAVSATWVVPKIAPRQTLGGEATWVGIGGVSGNDLIQAGTQSLSEGGAIEYEAWFELLPDVSRPVPLRVSAGDSVTVAITEVLPDRWQILFVNNSTGKQHARTVTYHSSRSSANWIEESPLIVGRRGVGLLPLADFAPVVFRAANTVKDGRALTPADAGALPLALYNRIGRALLAPSLLGEDGASFSVTKLFVAPRRSS